MINFRRIAAGSLHLLQREIKSAPRPILFPKPSDSVIGRPRWTTRALCTAESGETSTTSDPNKENRGEGYTKDELLNWVNRLHKDGKHEAALELFDWMDAKKMVSSPSEFALYLELLAKVKGLAFAKYYFKKVDPFFNEHDIHAKNWPAHGTLMRLTWEGYRKSGLRPLTYTYKLDN